MRLLSLIAFVAACHGSSPATTTPDDHTPPPDGSLALTPANLHGVWLMKDDSFEMRWVFLEDGTYEAGGEFSERRPYRIEGDQLFLEGEGTVVSSLTATRLVLGEGEQTVELQRAQFFPGEPDLEVTMDNLAGTWAAITGHSAITFELHADGRGQALYGSMTAPLWFHLDGGAIVFDAVPDSVKASGEDEEEDDPMKLRVVSLTAHKLVATFGPNPDAPEGEDTEVIDYFERR